MSITEVAVLSGHEDRIWCVRWSPSGSLLASCSGDKTIRIWKKNGDAWESAAILTDAHKGTIRSVAWSPCGNYLASCGFDATTCIWDRRGGEFECVATLEGHENEVKSVAWSSSGQYLATCSRDKSVWVWEVGEGCEYECASVLTTHTQDVKRVLWHPNKDVLASCSYDDTIKLYKEECDDWSIYCTLSSHTSTVWAVDFNNSGDSLVSCSDDQTVKIWREYLPGNSAGVQTTEDSTWKCVCTLSGHHDRAIYDVSWCDSTDLIATACGDNCIRIFKEDSGSDPNAPSFSLMTQLSAHEQDVNSIDWNPKVSGLLASCSDDNTIKIWEVK